jgi:beta-glucosidase
MPSIRVLPSLLVLFLSASSRAGLISGTVVDSLSNPIPSAVVTVLSGAPLPVARTLSDAQGRFSMVVPDPGAVIPLRRTMSEGIAVSGRETLRVRVIGLDGTTARSFSLPATTGIWRLENPQAALSGLPAGVWAVEIAGTSGSVGTLSVADGGFGGTPRLVPAAVSASPGARALDASGWRLRARLPGMLPSSQQVQSGQTGLVVVLRRDPIESRIDSVMKNLTLAQEIGQMTQGVVSKNPGSLVSTDQLGSVLSGGGDTIVDFDALQANARTTKSKIPVLYGIDAVHGHAKWTNAVVLPHNIGLGATRDTNLLRRLGENTAKEMWAGRCDWAFAPCIAVARDQRWGRTYESYGESPELVESLGAAYIRGLQGGNFDSAFAVVACAKHFMGDGGTAYGSSTVPATKTVGAYLLDQGNDEITEAALDSLHLPGYVAAVEAGVQTVMASYSSVNGVRMHENKAYLTDSLKTDLGFDGFVVSDWLAIEELPEGSYSDQVAASINAGVDMAMEPRSEALFESTLEGLVPGTVSQARIDDAVRRILRVKFRSGVMHDWTRNTAWDNDLGDSAHRALAREAVQKSLVVLKNSGPVLPLPKTGKTIAVWGASTTAGLQCGGWTLSWQGITGNVPGATTILTALQNAAPGKVSAVTSTTGKFDYAVVFAQESPYAEGYGDSAGANLGLSQGVLAAVANFKSGGAKVVLVLVTGRPRILGAANDQADAVVAAWLPGSEGEGVADVLFGDVRPTGVLPRSWPASAGQIPIDVGDASYAPLYPYGYGLSW